MSSAEPVVPVGRRWLIGAMAGAGAGLALLAGGVLGLVPLLLLAIWAFREPARTAAAAGIMTGIGGCVLALTVRAELACTPDSCVGPDLTTWYVLVLAVLGLGLLASVAVAVRALRR
jgi:hypothetical protein